MANPKEIMEKMMPERMKAEPHRLEGLEGCVIEYNITGPNGGTWSIVVKDDKTASVVSGKTEEKAGICVSVGEEDFLKMIEKKITPMALFMSGKLKMTGDRTKGMKLSQLV